MSWQIHGHFISRKSTHLEPKKQTIALNVDNYDWWPYMPWWNIADDSAYISWPRRIYWEAVPWSFTASYSQGIVTSLCVWDRLAVFCAICHHAIVGDPFLIWAKCERNENASSLQDMAKKTCLRRFRLCQPYVITHGFFPCRHHAMSKTIRTVGL